MALPPTRENTKRHKHIIGTPEGFDVMLQEKPHSNARNKEAAQNAIHFSLHKAVVLHGALKTRLCPT